MEGAEEVGIVMEAQEVGELRLALTRARNLRAFPQQTTLSHGRPFQPPIPQKKQRNDQIKGASRDIKAGNWTK